MYAAYSYEKVRDDELTFEKGECLKVIERDGDERAWWLCERFAVGDEPLQRGLVPRNYLALYPSLLDRPNDFITFELPIRCVISRDEDNARFDDKNGNNNMLKADILEKVLIDEQPPALSVPWTRKWQKRRFLIDQTFVSGSTYTKITKISHLSYSRNWRSRRRNQEYRAGDLGLSHNRQVLYWSTFVWIRLAIQGIFRKEVDIEKKFFHKILHS